MKIFIVCNKLCFGGAEKVGVMLANGLLRKGHQVCVVADLDWPQTYETDAGICQLKLYSYSNGKILRWLSALRNLRNYFKSYKPNVVIGITESCSLISLFAGVGLNIKVIETIHNSFERPKERPMKFYEKLLKFHLSKLFPCVTVLTQADKKVIDNKLHNLVVMPNPLSLSPALCVPKKEKVILAAGRLEASYTKGFDLLIEAWGKIANLYPDWILEIAGQGTPLQVEKFNQLLIKNKCWDKVKFLGFQQDMESLYKRASIFVLSSRYEGFGMVLVEAMSQGCACIACDFKGRQKEIIRNEKEGVICPVGSSDAIKNAIMDLVENTEKRKNIQKNAIERSKAFCFDSIIDKWDALLNNLIL